MKRRTALEILGFSTGAFAFFPRHFPSGEPGDWHQDRGGELESAFSHLRGDSARPAFVRKTEKGWSSVYVGAAPLNADVLRTLAQDAGLSLWSDQADIVYATRDAVTVIATAGGERTLTFPRPMCPVDGGAPSMLHRVTMDFGEVRLFVAPEA